MIQKIAEYIATHPQQLAEQIAAHIGISLFALFVAALIGIPCGCLVTSCFASPPDCTRTFL